MTESTTHLRRKIGSAADLQSVVRAMKAQAAASVGQYADSVAALADYARTVELGLAACFRPNALADEGAASTAPADVPQQTRSPQQTNPPVRVVLFGSDQGLVGRFNDRVVEYASQHVLAQHPQAQVWAVGARLLASLADSGWQVRGNFAVPATAQAITRLVSDLLVSVVGAAGHPAPDTAEPAEPTEPNIQPELHLIYNRPTAQSAYTPVGQKLLPLDRAWQRERAAHAWPTALPPQVLGERTETLRGMIREYIYVSIFRASAESLASENASRLAAMDRADRNIDTMLLTLNERFHRLRQSSIDEELSDVISGFKALSQPTGG